ncbi:hypothetical protein PR001_g8211 [Phytophthora rubi]|uniref:Uncharacterized protein n=1 Tax=Phytophthora rubi TaxID=129364 RepID=A0A6A3N384_9STRA|nr:hypothetical protein PR001_g8211 [Phytophthora rubi]
MDPDYVSDDSMSSSFEFDGSDLSDTPSEEMVILSEETVILLTPPSSPEPVPTAEPMLYVSSMGAVETSNHMPNCVPEFRRRPPPTILDRTDQTLLTTDEICVRDVPLTPWKFGA